jgi:hypothetical protein
MPRQALTKKRVRLPRVRRLRRPAKVRRVKMGRRRRKVGY